MERAVITNAPAILIAFMNVGLIVAIVFAFFYLYRRTKNRLYLAFSLMGLSGLFFTAGEALVLVIGGLFQEFSFAMQIYRLQAISVATIFITFPYLVKHFLTLNKTLHRINKIVLIFGWAFFILIFIIAFVSPELFSSVTVMDRLEENDPFFYGRGVFGPISTLRDIYVGLLIIYFICVYLYELIVNKNRRYVFISFIGILMLAIGGALDILSIQVGHNVDPLGNYNFSRYISGFTLYLLFSMASFGKKYMDDAMGLSQAKEDFENKLFVSQKMAALGELAGGIAHDFNNQLMVIKGYSQSMLVKEDLDLELIKKLKIIDSTVDNSANLISKLLTFAKKKYSSQEMCNMHLIIRDTLDIFKHSSKNKINIILDFNAKESIVKGSVDYLQNVFLNLFLNAQDAMNDKGTIHISTNNVFLDDLDLDGRQKDKKYIEIIVSDDGSGIDDNIKSHIFDPFFTTKTKDNGTGMGLSMVYGTIMSHKGQIFFRKNKPKGATFVIHLPINSEMEDVKKKGEIMVKKKFNKKLILIDDNKDVLESLSFALKNYGLNIISFSNGNDAIDYYIKNKDNVDAVVSDLVMPAMDGEELFYQIRKINPDCKFIIISGNADTEQIDGMTKKGLYAHFQKPFNFDKLVEKI